MLLNRLLRGGLECLVRTSSACIIHSNRHRSNQINQPLNKPLSIYEWINPALMPTSTQPSNASKHRFKKSQEHPPAISIPFFQKPPPLFCNFWKIGGILAGGYAFKLLHDFNEPAYSEGKSTITDSSSRHQPVDGLHDDHPNEEISDPELLGLVVTEDNGWLKIQGVESPFRAKIVNGMLIWRSIRQIAANDMKVLCGFYKTLEEKSGKKRSILINTGIHGNKKGKASVKKELANPSKFVHEDINIFYTYDRFAVHVVSKTRPPINESELPFIDIIDAWCYSAITKDFSMYTEEEKQTEAIRIARGSIPLEEILYSLGQIGFRNKKFIRGSAYVEPNGIKSVIKEKLLRHSFCYVEGTGGFGKSRLAAEIENDLIVNIDRGLDNLYLEEVFVSLKTKEDKDRFFTHMRNLLVSNNSSASENSLIIQYFNLLSDLAEKNKKKVLIVIDNVDTDEDYRLFTEIYKEIEKHGSSFHVLLTGRRDLAAFIESHQISKGNSAIDLIVKIKEYHEGEVIIWNLFLNNFIADNLKDNEHSQKYINKHKDKLLKLFSHYENNPGLTIVFAKMLSRDYDYGVIDKSLTNLEELFESAIANSSDLPDYQKFNEIANIPLKVMDEKHGGYASIIYDAISLISDSYVRYDFLKDVVVECDEDSKGNFSAIIKELIDNGLLTRAIVNGSSQLTMPQFYKDVGRVNLANKYRKNRRSENEINTIVKIVLDKIDELLDKNDANGDELMYFLRLFDFANSKKLGSLSDQISFSFVKYATRQWDKIKYQDVTLNLKRFLCEVMRIQGYGVDQVFYNLIYGKSIYLNLSRVLQEIQSNSQTMRLNGLKKLNNLYVINRNCDGKKLTEIENQLKEVLKENWIDEDLKRDIESNLDSNKSNGDLVVFPNIEFVEQTTQGRTRAEDWKKHYSTREKSKIIEKSKEADLSHRGMHNELRLLRHYLLEEQKIEKLDLSHNGLGYNKNGAGAVGEILRYSTSLKVVKLDNNSLHNNQNFNFSLLAEGLADNQSLEELHLNNNSLDDGNIQTLCEALKHHEKIKVVKLHHNKFSDKGIAYLKELMKNRPNISIITTELCFWPYHNGTKQLKRENDEIKIII